MYVEFQFCFKVLENTKLRYNPNVNGEVLIIYQSLIKFPYLLNVKG